jgi:hypothetical protein
MRAIIFCSSSSASGGEEEDEEELLEEPLLLRARFDFFVVEDEVRFICGLFDLKKRRRRRRVSEQERPTGQDLVYFTV